MFCYHFDWLLWSWFCDTHLKSARKRTTLSLTLSNLMLLILLSSDQKGTVVAREVLRKCVVPEKIHPGILGGEGGVKQKPSEGKVWIFS